MPLDLSSDDCFMGERRRLARMAYETDDVSLGAVIVGNAKIIAHPQPGRNESGKRWEALQGTIHGIT
jgi:tRNA(Arg) A34 adenosine deaminase TadA